MTISEEELRRHTARYLNSEISLDEYNAIIKHAPKINLRAIAGWQMRREFIDKVEDISHAAIGLARRLFKK